MAAGLAREVAADARGSVRDLSDALDAEMFASSLVSTWDFGPPMPGDVDTEKEIGLRTVTALERAGDARALAVLRAIASIGSETIGPASEAAADRLAEAGVKEPAWREGLGAARGLRAKIMRDAIFDDATNMVFEFERPGQQPYAILILIDHNLGGIAKDIIVGPPVGALEEAVANAPKEQVGVGEMRFDEVELAEAAGRCREALWRTGITLEAPVGEDFNSQVAAVAAHLRLLPDAGETYEPEEISEAERQAALDGFLASPEAKPFAKSGDAEDLAYLAINYGSDYVGGEGRPLRWSPVVVELFMCDHLPGKVLRDREFFEDSVPEILEAWVRYAGRSRGIPEEAIEYAAGAVGAFREEMLALVGDQSTWGLSKTFMAAAEDAGVDITDESALEDFIDEYNSRDAA